MNKPAFPKSHSPKSIIHPSVISFYGVSQLSEDDYYNLGSHASKKKLASTHISKISKSGISVDFPHTWEMTDYDDDHFEWVSFTEEN